MGWEVVASTTLERNEEGKGGIKARRHVANEEGERRSMRARILTSGGLILCGPGSSIRSKT